MPELKAGRDLPLLPTSVVGSHARPGWWTLFLEASQTRVMGPLDIKEVAEDGVRVAIQDMTDAGIDVISDGEMQRFGNFYAHYYDRFENFPVSDEPPSRTIGVYHYDQLRRHETTGPVRAPEGLGIADEYAFARANTTKPLKVTVPGPLTLSRDTRLTAHYTTLMGLAYDLAKIINAEIKSLEAAGVDFIQLDEPASMYVSQEGVAVNTEARELVDLSNVITDGVNIKLALHICFGNLSGRPNQANRSYRRLFPILREIKVDQFVFEFANRQLLDAEIWKEFDVQQELAAGVVDQKAFAVETAEDVADRIRGLLKHIPAEKLWLTSDCGFSASPRWVSVAKLRAMVEGARIVRRELGV